MSIKTRKSVKGRKLDKKWSSSIDNWSGKDSTGGSITADSSINAGSNSWVKPLVTSGKKDLGGGNGDESKNEDLFEMKRFNYYLI